MSKVPFSMSEENHIFSDDGFLVVKKTQILDKPFFETK